MHLDPATTRGDLIKLFRLLDTDSDGWGDNAAQLPYTPGSDCDDTAVAIFPGNIPR